jgi:hypothetical protein
MMKHLSLAVLLAFLLASAGLSHSEAEPQTAAATFRTLQERVGEILTRFSDGSTDHGKLARAINSDANLITDKWMSASNKAVSLDYLLTLKVDSDLLHQAATEENSENAKRILKSVAGDLNTKARQAKSPVAAAEVLGGSIIVSVRTRRNGHDVEGYLVRCNPERYAGQSPAMFPFNNPTNEAKRILPPGDYFMWLETQNGQTVASRPVSIGGNGEDTEPPIVFDLP